MWLSLMCTSNRVVELNHCPLLECRCHTTVSEGHATGCSSRSHPCSLLGAWVTTLLERWCGSSLGLNVISISASARCGGAAGCLTGSLALPLEPPKCTSANTCLVLIQHSSSKWFRLTTSIGDVCLVFRWRSTQSLAESTLVHQHSCPPIRAQHTELWSGGTVLCAGFMPSSSSSMEMRRSQVSVSWVVLKIWLAEGPTDGAVV